MIKLEQQNPGCGKTVRRRSWSRALAYDRSLPPDIVQALWDGPADRLIHLGTPLQIKDRAVVVRYQHSSAPFLLKRHVWGGATRTARMIFRVTTARRCAKIGRYMYEQGIPTPRPRAFLEYCFGPFAFRSYLLTDYIPGESLFHYIRYHLGSADEVQHIARQVAQIWQRLVQLKISHNDLKPENFIVDERKRVWLIDMEKVRIHRDETQLIRRHLKDARQFLHVRNWRDQCEASEIFRRELMDTSLGEWSASDTLDKSCTLRHGYRQSEMASRISVAIVTDQQVIDPQTIMPSVESVRDMADEIVLLGSSAQKGEFEVRSSLQCEERLACNAQLPVIAIGRPPSHPWVVVLKAGERATPGLVRELCEIIADNPDCDAVRIPVEQIMFGHPIQPDDRSQPAPIRAFHQARCSFSLVDGVVNIPGVEERTLLSPRKIERDVCHCFYDFVEDLNRQTTASAKVRLQQGNSPHVLKGLIRSITRFMREYLLYRGFRDGWVGLQVAVVKALFTWVEEVKLWQLLTNFQRLQNAGAASDGSDGSESIAIHKEVDQSQPDHDLRADCLSKTA